jgi:hypothetical protein
MYAINHAATALLIKRKQPTALILPLLISVQLVEILWVIFNYLDWEHFSVSNGRLHLDFLPYSHSVFSVVVAALFHLLLSTGATRTGNLPLLFNWRFITLVIDGSFMKRTFVFHHFRIHQFGVWELLIIHF